jgi:transcriptional regulator with GAF, ATPase, and Fis domain
MFDVGWDGSDSEDALRRIVGKSERMRGVREQIRAISPLDSTVLLTGETGTGKGLAARSIHQLSTRVGSPFVHVDCAALSPTVIESEFFGHERGSFTSAMSRHVGRFELAGRGTIFLDEIGDLEPRLQSKLLRVLDDREFERIGGTRTLSMQARVVAATSRDLRRAVEEQRFRPDLYFRLNVFQVALPPLRERTEDLPALVGEGLETLAARLGLLPPHPTPEFLARLAEHSWRGNVRELMNVLERLLVRRAGGMLSAADLDGMLEDWSFRSGGSRETGTMQTLSDLVEEIGEVERREILAALEWSGGNVTGAARRLRIPRSTLRHRIRKYKLDATE